MTTGSSTAQRRLERQGLSPREADQAVALALKTLAAR